MARIRTIKPEFFTSDTVTALALRTRLTWIGMWTYCDDYGRCRDNVKLIKAAVWPLDDVSTRDIEIDLNTLADCRLIYRYTGADGKQYIQVTNWREHQKVDHPSKSPIPAPSEEPVSPPVPPSNNGHSAQSRNTPADSRSDDAYDPSCESREGLASPREDVANPRGRKGREGNREGTRARAREEPPAPRCPDHINDTKPPPCGACADARHIREQWELDRAQAVSLQQQERARQTVAERQAAIDACGLCNERGYRNGHLCNHVANAADQARRGRALVDAAIRPYPRMDQP